MIPTQMFHCLEQIHEEAFWVVLLVILSVADKRYNSSVPPPKYNIHSMNFSRTHFHSRARHFRTRRVINLRINEIKYRLSISSCLGERC